MVTDNKGNVLARGLYYAHNDWITVMRIDPGYTQRYISDVCFMNRFIRIDPHQYVIPAWTREFRKEFIRHAGK